MQHNELNQLTEVKKFKKKVKKPDISEPRSQPFIIRKESE